jgi:hypothetical protein
MSLTKPSFDSKVPEYLLKDASDKDKYIIEQLSIIGQQSNWVIDETIKQSVKLETLDEKVSYTNGSVNEHKKLISELNETKEDVNQIVSVKRFVCRYLLNRYSIAVSFVFGLGFIKILTNSELREFLFKIIGLG